MSPLANVRGVATLDIAQWSLEFSDPKQQQLHDVRRIFIRGYHWVCGTEAGQPALQEMLRREAVQNGYTFFVFKSNWIAVRKTLIVPGSYKKHGITVLDNEVLTTHGHDPSITVVSFVIEEVGKVTILASHYPKDGSPVKDYHPNLKWNKELAEAIGEEADDAGEGFGLVVYHGDQNINDRLADTFLNRADMTSVQDELKKWESTGFGPIDVIATYDTDRRVEAKYARVVDDSELHLFMDHYPLEVGLKVRVLND